MTQMNAYRHKIRTNTLIFWTLMIALLSAISTTIFSESFQNDSFGFALMGIALIGLFFNIIHIFFNTILDICNPTNEP